MYGLKENVIIGKLIPAGTGLPIYRHIGLESKTGETLEVTEEEKVFETAKKREAELSQA